MVDFKSFRLFDANTGFPKDDATPTILHFVDRTGAPRTPPAEGVLNLGGGFYRVRMSDADVAAGTAVLVSSGPGALPTYVSGTAYPWTQPFDAMHFEDQSGVLMGVGAPTIPADGYRSLLDGAPRAAPALIPLVAPYFYGIAPTAADLAVGVVYAVDPAAGSINSYTGSFFTEDVAVDIFITDESPIPIPMAGVEVGIFHPTTGLYIAGAVSDVTGKASFMLPGSPTPGTAYEVRLFKLGVDFHGLHQIMVTDPVLAGAPNRFDITGADTNILPISSSPLLCRCTGVFVDFRGQPIANKTIRFVSEAMDMDKHPKVWNTPSRMVAADELEVVTDANGRVSLDLIRTGRYFVTWGSDDDLVWQITVPDEEAVNLIDLIHPFPVSWDWDDTAAPGDAVSVPVGMSVDVPIEVLFSDYSERATALETFFDIINSDGTKVESTYDSNRGVLVLKGLAAGIATQTPTLKEGILPARYPVPAVTVPVLTVTVT